jgi:ribosome-associated protein YbcJ (S4-like RNA binding protein)
MIAKAEGDLSGSMRIVKADGEVTNRKHRKEFQKQVIDLHRQNAKKDKKTY